ncbi:MAG TPA: hypothetical protein VI172_14800 [Candidatus Dormibacteraeota bacterium]|jgi:hypothetical protein
MAHVPADRLTVVLDTGRERRYHDVTYCLWTDASGPGVTVYRDGVEIARHEGTQGTYSNANLTMV